MRLHNPTERMVFLRDDINRTMVVMKPKETISVAPHMRQVFAPYVQAFDLRWELDDTDLPPGMGGEDVAGTHRYFEKHDEEVFNATKAVAQSDSAEIAEIWKEHDVVSLVPHVSTRKPGTETDDDFLFLKESSEQETKIVHEIAKVTDDDLRAMLTGHDEAWEGEWKDGEPSTVSADSKSEGPDYLRNNDVPDGLEDFGGEEYTSENGEGVDGGETTKLPHDAPVTISQLTLSTKAQLFEMADKIGVDANGTKKEIIDRICKYYWKTHATKISLEASRH